jgi:ligand-binding sensor protein
MVSRLVELEAFCDELKSIRLQRFSSHQKCVLCGGVKAVITQKYYQGKHR